MKLGVVLLGLLWSTCSVAGGYYHPMIDTYDPDSGFYYRGVVGQQSSGFISSTGDGSIENIYIYDPETGKGTYLFPEQDDVNVVTFAFETSVDDGTVQFRGAHGLPIRNNVNVPDRSVKSRMLVVLRNTDTSSETFYFAEKDGTGLVKARTITAEADWHVDVKNSVIRVIEQTGMKLSVESFEW